MHPSGATTSYEAFCVVGAAVKGIDLPGLLGDIKEDPWGMRDGSPPAGYRGKAPVGSLGERSSPRAEAFFVKLHIIFALKYNKQQLLLLLDKINDIISKLLGDITMYVLPS